MGNEEDIKRILELMRTTPLVELEEKWSQFSRQVDFSTIIVPYDFCREAE